MVKVSALIKEPGKKARHVNISDTLQNLQKIVGGYIESVTITSDCCVLCNEEGRLMGLPYNCEICGASFVGTIILVGTNGEEFADLPMTFEKAKHRFPQLFKED